MSFVQGARLADVTPSTALELQPNSGENEMSDLLGLYVDH